MTPRSCGGSRSKSSKLRPPNCARNGPGPKRCSISNTASWRNTRACVSQPAEVPADIAAEIERIEQRLGELEELGEDEFTEELMAEAAQLEERRTEIDETIDGLAVYSDKDRARAGCIVTIGDDGEFCLHQGLVERTAMRGASRIPGSRRRRRRCIDVATELDDDDGEPSGPRLTAEQKLRKECGFSQLLVDDLKAHRLQITRAHLAGNFVVAFDLALYSLCVDLFERFGYRSRPLELRATETAPRSSLNDLSGTPADRLLETHGSALELDWLKLPPAQGFAALAALPSDDKQRLFAWCIASCLKPQLAIEDRADPVIESAGRRLAIPFADYWRPTAANYWGRAKKAHGLAIGRGDPRRRAGRAITPTTRRPALAAALENAFDPAASSQLHRSRAGGARQRRRLAAARHGLYGGQSTRFRGSRHDGAAHIDVDDDGEAGDMDTRQPTCPAFLTEDEPVGAALNGASAP